jgi:hypothetical protein
MVGGDGSGPRRGAPRDRRVAASAARKGTNIPARVACEVATGIPARVACEVATGISQLVVLSGEAGAGKSRLAAEFVGSRRSWWSRTSTNSIRR